MHRTVNNLIEIKNQLKEYNTQLIENKTKIIAVSKTFSVDQILPLVEYAAYSPTS